jgi:hypothetical protein
MIWIKHEVDVRNAVAFESIDELDFHKSMMQSNYVHVCVSDQSLFHQKVTLNGANAVLFEIHAVWRYSRMCQHGKVVGCAFRCIQWGVISFFQAV